MNHFVSRAESWCLRQVKLREGGVPNLCAMNAHNSEVTHSDHMQLSLVVGALYHKASWQCEPGCTWSVSHMWLYHTNKRSLSIYICSCLRPLLLLILTLCALCDQRSEFRGGCSYSGTWRSMLCRCTLWRRMLISLSILCRQMEGSVH